MYCDGSLAKGMEQPVGTLRTEEVQAIFTHDGAKYALYHGLSSERDLVARVAN